MAGTSGSVVPLWPASGGVVAYEKFKIQSSPDARRPDLYGSALTSFVPGPRMLSQVDNS